MQINHERCPIFTFYFFSSLVCFRRVFPRLLFGSSVLSRHRLSGKTTEARKKKKKKESLLCCNFLHSAPPGAQSPVAAWSYLAMDTTDSGIIRLVAIPTHPPPPTPHEGDDKPSCPSRSRFISNALASLAASIQACQKRAKVIWLMSLETDGADVCRRLAMGKKNKIKK